MQITFLFLARINLLFRSCSSANSRAFIAISICCFLFCNIFRRITTWATQHITKSYNVTPVKIKNSSLLNLNSSRCNMSPSFFKVRLPSEQITPHKHCDARGCGGSDAKNNFAPFFATKKPPVDPLD